jgi:HCO3- transporter family
MKSTLADFAVLLAVVICTGIDIGFGLNTPKLNVPSEFKPTRPDRSRIILALQNSVNFNSYVSV